MTPTFLIRSRFLPHLEGLPDLESHFTRVPVSGDFLDFGDRLWRADKVVLLENPPPFGPVAIVFWVGATVHLTAT